MRVFAVLAVLGFGTALVALGAEIGRVTKSTDTKTVTEVRVVQIPAPQLSVPLVPLTPPIFVPPIDIPPAIAQVEGRQPEAQSVVSPSESVQPPVAPLPSEPVCSPTPGKKLGWLKHACHPARSPQ